MLRTILSENFLPVVQRSATFHLIALIRGQRSEVRGQSYCPNCYISDLQHRTSDLWFVIVYCRTSDFWHPTSDLWI